MWWIVGDGGFDVLDATDDARGVAGALPMLKINGAGRPGRGTMAPSSHVIACNSATAAADAAAVAAAAEAAAAAVAAAAATLSSAARRREDDDVDASDITRDKSKDKSSVTAATIAKPGDPVDSVLNVESVEVIVANDDRVPHVRRKQLKASRGVGLNEGRIRTSASNRRA
jgi:hypothetical protein